MHPPILSNAELTVEMVPTRDADWETIIEFARTFDAYSYWGSFHRCAEVANAQASSTLTELRTCLFFEHRRWHHFGDYPDPPGMEYIRGLLDKIRAFILAGDRA